MLDTYLREAAEALADRQKTLGERIAHARRDKHWKLKHLAAAVHVEPVTVSRWERGIHAPDLEMLERIATETGKPFSFFLDPLEPGVGVEALTDRLDAMDERLARLEEAAQAVLDAVRSS